VKTGSNPAEFSKQDYGSKRADLAMMMMMMMMMMMIIIIIIIIVIIIINVTWMIKAVASTCRAVPCRAELGRAAPRCLLHNVVVNTSRQRCHGDDSTVLSYYVSGRCWAIVQ
jgi:hypothetical protein